MLFNSLTFLLFFMPIVMFIYFLIPNIKIKNIVLFLFSLFFYAWGEPIFVLLMIINILTTYLFGLLIESNRNKKMYMIISLILNIGLLIVFKYEKFFIDNINYILKININSLNLPLPVGISFYTFQSISYLIDVYRKKVKSQKNIINLGLYLSLFPQLIAGPIVRYDYIEKQLENRNHSIQCIEFGLKRFIIGLSKKVFIANTMALIADTIFGNNWNGTLLLWIGSISYTLQIYYDFSGYSDMAIGLGKIFGFEFLENFDYPYISKSITEFWRRWHISLSSWFRDYVYIPLGGSKVSKLKHIMNLFIVWLLTGFWHGASWNYIIWGLYYFSLLIIEKFILKEYINKIPKLFRHFFTLFLVVIGWVIFKVDDIPLLFIKLKNMVCFSPSDIGKFISSNAYLISNFYLFIPAIIFCIPLKKKSNGNIILDIFVNIVYILLFITNIIILSSNSYNPFIYFRF